MKNKEKEFKDYCAKHLPKYIEVEKQAYRRSKGFLLGMNIFQIHYFAYDGNFVDTQKVLFKGWYPVTKKGTTSDSPKVFTKNQIVKDCKRHLEEFNYYVLGEVVTKDELFRRELTVLLNKYCKENKSDTPDFILADHLIQSLRAFNISTNARQKYYGKDVPTIEPIVIKE